MSKLTTDYINNLLDTAEVQEHTFHYGKSFIVSYRLKNGFTVEGRSGLVNISNFDIEIGRKIAREDAFRQLTKLETYKSL